MIDSPKHGAPRSNVFQIIGNQGDRTVEPVRIHVLGGFRVVVRGRDLRLRTRKEALVLLRLALAAPEAVRRDELLGMLWPDSSEARARHSLSEALRGIEQATELRIRRTADELRIDEDAIWTDLRHLNDALARGDIDEAGRVPVGGFLAGWYPPTAEASHWIDGLAASVHAHIDRAAHAQLDARRRATDSRGVTAAVSLLERIGAATDADREAAAEAEQITGWESLKAGDAIPPRIPVDREGPFVGRTREMQLLTAELERALAGELRVVLVAGEAGIGKTRTCQRLARLAALRGARLFLSSCYELEQSVAFGAISEAFSGAVTPSDLAGLKPTWREVLGEVLSDVGDTKSETMSISYEHVSTRRIMSAVSGLFQATCERRPGFVLIDDIQWADSTSCEIIHYLLRSATPAAGGLIVLAFRPEEIAPSSAADALLRSCKALGGSALVLGAMSDDEIHDQITNLLPESKKDLSLVPAIAGGNPFFARELALAEGSRFDDMGSIDEVVQNRVANLPNSEREVIELLAVAGAPVSVLDLSRVLELPITNTMRAVAALDKRRLIREVGASVAVTHEIARNAIYARMPVFARKSLHAALATTLAAMASSSFLANHFSLAGIVSEARRHAAAAAEESRRKKAFVEELGWLLLILQNSSGEEVRPALDATVNRMFALSRYSDAAKLLCDYSRTLDRPLQAKLEIARLKGATQSPDSYRSLLGRCDSLFQECISLAMQTEAIEALREKMRLAGDAGDRSMVLATADDLETFGRKCHNASEGAHARAIALLKLASFEPDAVRARLDSLMLEKLDKSPTPASFTIGLVDALDHYNRGYVKSAAFKFLNLSAFARSTGDLGEEVQCRALLVPISTEVMRFGRAERHARFVLAYAQLADAHWARVLALLNLAACRLERGDLSGARAVAQTVLSAAAPHLIWHVRAYAMAVLVQCALEEGRVLEMSAMAAQLETVLPDPDWWISDISLIVVSLSRAWRRQGRETEAIALMEAAATHALGKQQVCYWTVVLELASTRWRLEGVDPTAVATVVRQEAAIRGCTLIVNKADRVLGGAAVAS